MWSQNSPVPFLLIQNKAKVLTMALKAPLDLSPGYSSGLTFKFSHLDPAIQLPLPSEHNKHIPGSGNHAGLECSSYIFIPRVDTTMFCSNVTWSVRLLLSLIFPLVCISHHFTHYSFTVSLQPGMQVRWWQGLCLRYLFLCPLYLEQSLVG